MAFGLSLIVFITLFAGVVSDADKEYINHLEDGELPDYIKKYIHVVVKDVTANSAKEIDRLKKQIEDSKNYFENEIRNLKRRLIKNEKQCTSTIYALQSDMGELGERIKIVEKSNMVGSLFDGHVRMNNNNSSLLDNGFHMKNSDLQSKLNMRRPITNTADNRVLSKISSRKARVPDATIKARKAVEVLDHRVAFFASLTSDIHHLGADQDIVFDNAITNIGNAYNANHGTFIAPVDGTYVFSVTLKHAELHSTWGHFVVNGQVVAKLFVRDDGSSQTIVVNLHQGDDVSVQNTMVDRGFYGDRYSTFCGFLLYQGLSSSVIVG